MPEIPCPVCGKLPIPGPDMARLRPFCSQRCADIDLGRWFTGHYRVPAAEQEDEPDLTT